MKKNAFLVIAHNEWSILKKLLELLDHPQNDIYLHIDKKAGEINEKEFAQVLQHSKLYFVERMSIAWGGDSQVWCEYRLLEEATKRKYEYYHLLSGVDMPIKDIHYINKYFEDNKGKEFLRFDSEYSTDSKEVNKVKYYYLWQNKIGNGNPKTLRVMFLKVLQKCSVIMQKIIGINRVNKKGIEFQKGSNWFDITHDCAMYVVDNRKLIEKHFAKTLCGDEFLIQSLICSSPYKNNISTERVRYVDWNRGKPYVFESKDYEELLAVPSLFARKFSTQKDAEIIERIYYCLKTKV